MISLWVAPRSGRPAPSPTRSASRCGSARSQTTVPHSRISLRLSALSTAPPATETTVGCSLVHARREDLGLDLAEGGLAIAGEDLGHGVTGERLDVGVGVPVVPTQTTGDELSGRRLATTHHPDEQDAGGRHCAALLEPAPGLGRPVADDGVDPSDAR